MAKLRRHHWQGSVRNRYETSYGRQVREHANSGKLLRTYSHHHKNVRRHHRR